MTTIDPLACHLALTLLRGYEACPVCGCLASEHGGWQRELARGGLPEGARKHPGVVIVELEPPLDVVPVPLDAWLVAEEVSAPASPMLRCVHCMTVKGNEECPYFDNKPEGARLSSLQVARGLRASVKLDEPVEHKHTSPSNTNTRAGRR